MRYTLSLVALLCGIGAISPAYAACPTNDTCSFLYSGGTYTDITRQGSIGSFASISSVASGIMARSLAFRATPPVILSYVSGLQRCE
jgi:hypothetical protein